MGIFIAAPVPVVLKDGRAIMVSPLSERDLMGFLKYARQQKLTSLLESIPKDLPRKDRLELSRIAMQEADNFDMDSNTVWQDIDNIQMILYLSIRKKTPITLEEVRTITEDEENFRAILAVLNDSPETEEPQKKSENPD